MPNLQNIRHSEHKPTKREPTHRGCSTAPSTSRKSMRTPEGHLSWDIYLIQCRSVKTSEVRPVFYRRSMDRKWTVCNWYRYNCKSELCMNYTLFCFDFKMLVVQAVNNSCMELLNTKQLKRNISDRVWNRLNYRKVDVGIITRRSIKLTSNLISELWWRESISRAIHQVEYIYLNSINVRRMNSLYSDLIKVNWVGMQSIMFDTSMIFKGFVYILNIDVTYVRVKMSFIRQTLKLSLMFQGYFSVDYCQDKPHYTSISITTRWLSVCDNAG